LCLVCRIDSEDIVISYHSSLCLVCRIDPEDIIISVSCLVTAHVCRMAITVGKVLAQLAHFVSAHTLHHHHLHIVSLLIFMHRVYSLGHMITAYIYVPDDTHVGYNSTA